MPEAEDTTTAPSMNPTAKPGKPPAGWRIPEAEGKGDSPTQSPTTTFNEISCGSLTQGSTDEVSGAPYTATSGYAAPDVVYKINMDHAGTFVLTVCPESRSNVARTISKWHAWAR